MGVQLRFDTARIGIGDSYIARATSLETFVFLLKAGGIACRVTEEDTVSVDNVSLLHNLHGKCYFRFSNVKGAPQTFLQVRLVIDPELYPGLKEASGAKRMAMLKDFVSVSLGDRMNAMSVATGDNGTAGFTKVGEGEYESALVRVRHEMDRYHAVITLSYKERSTQKTDTPVTLREQAALQAQLDAMEKRIERVEQENRELRKVNDLILELFGSMKPAHDLTKALIPEDRAGASGGMFSGSQAGAGGRMSSVSSGSQAGAAGRTASVSAGTQTGAGSSGEAADTPAAGQKSAEDAAGLAGRPAYAEVPMSQARRNSLIEKYLK